MRKIFFATFCAGALSINLALAQVSSVSGVGTASSAPGVAAPNGVIGGTGITVQPINPDNNESDDDIVQLNNLIVAGVEGIAFPYYLNVYYDPGVQCRKFGDLESSRSSIFPCPLSPTVVYRVKVDSDTRLLLRNRARAAISDFAGGDKVNIYGFMDRDSQFMEALIVRNLDKPVVKRFIQLNNMEVVALPGSGLPTTLVVVDKGSSCLDYSGAKGVMIPCPLGMSEMGGASSPLAPGFYYYPRVQQYSIQVNKGTAVFQRNRTPMNLSDVALGDKVNVYGVQDSRSREIDAYILRDLSFPRNAANGSLRVSVTDPTIVCALSNITTPCGIIYGATVEIYDSNGSFVKSLITDKGAAIFEGLKEGSYTVKGRAEGYEDSKVNVKVTAGAVAQLNLALYKVKEIPGLSEIKVLSPNGGEKWAKGSTQTIRWSAPNSIASVSILLVSWTPPCDSKTTPCPLMPTTIYTLDENTVNSGSFNWIVGRDNYAKDIPEGQYVVRVRAFGTNNYDDSDTPLSVIAASDSSAVKVLFPNGGETLVRGVKNLISWSGGKGVVQIGLAKPEAELHTIGDYLIGWINVSGAPNGMMAWDAAKTCDLTLTVCKNLEVGKYKIVAVSGDANGNLLLTGNVDLSDGLIYTTQSTISEYPELRVLDLTTNATYLRGGHQLATFVATVKNEGLADIFTPFKVNVGGQATEISQLRRNDKHTVEGNLGLSTPGFNDVSAIVDFENKVQESDESNNTLTKPFFVNPTYNGEGTTRLGHWESLGLYNGLVLYADGKNIEGETPKVNFKIYDGNAKYQLVAETGELKAGDSWVSTGKIPQYASIQVNSFTVKGTGGADWTVEFRAYSSAYSGL